MSSAQLAAQALAAQDEVDAQIAGLRGERLWGDDFDVPAIAAWHADEKEAFAQLVASLGGHSPSYVYHALNQHHGFRFLPAGRFERVLGFGSAWGDEFAPIAERVEQLDIVDPSDAWGREPVHGIPTRWLKPVASGELPFDDASFDLVTSLGALHHVANVSRVMSELARVLRPGGHLLLREPIVSMGDWRQPRTGLTKRERGIPLPIFRRIWAETGLRVLRQALCAFPATPRLRRLTGRHPFLEPWAVSLDAGLSRLFAWNLRYHRRNVFEKLCPTCVYAVLRRS
jgi:SAM-dependent methyltransferase